MAAPFRDSGELRTAGGFAEDRSWLRRLVWLPALLVPLAALVLLLQALRPIPVNLLALVGRPAHACVREIVFVDLSGSMAGAAGERDEAVHQLLQWAPHNLSGRRGDQLAVVAFDDRAAVERRPATVDADTYVRRTTIGGGGTSLSSAFDAAAAFSTTRCSTGAVVVSDGAIADAPSDVAAARARAGIDSVALVRVGPSTPSAWSVAFPSTPVFAADGSADAVTVAIAHATAMITGQRLVRR